MNDYIAFIILLYYMTQINENDICFIEKIVL
jgi:hypothetical protein